MSTTEWLDFDKSSTDNKNDYCYPPNQYRKKPITIIASQAKCGGHINTLEGRMRFEKGDYIITGIKGEMYAVRKDIFEETYGKVLGSES